jgi:hypothetical protein
MSHRSAPLRTAPNRSEPNRAEPRRTAPNRAKPRRSYTFSRINRTEPRRTAPNRAGPRRIQTAPDKTAPNGAKSASLRYKARFPQIPDGSARCGRFCCYSTARYCAARGTTRNYPKSAQATQTSRIPPTPSQSPVLKVLAYVYRR